MNDKLLSQREAAKLLGIGRTKLYELQRSGEIPFQIVNGRRYVTEIAIRDYLAAHVILTADEAIELIYRAVHLEDDPAYKELFALTHPAGGNFSAWLGDLPDRLRVLGVTPAKFRAMGRGFERAGISFNDAREYIIESFQAVEARIDESCYGRLVIHRPSGLRVPCYILEAMRRPTTKRDSKR